MQHTRNLRSFSTAAATVKPFTAIQGPKSVPPYGTYPEMIQQAAATSAVDVVNGYYKKYFPIMRHDFGPIPEVWVFDPELAKKTILNEGTYPRTIATEMWPINKYFTDRKLKLGLTSIGPEWKDLRTKLQKDMFAPNVSESYLPILDPVVKEISKILPECKDMVEGINFAAFDMFLSVIVGLFPRTTQGLIGGKVDPDDLQFVKDSITVLAKLLQAVREPHIPEHYEMFCKAHDSVLARGKHYVRVAAGNNISLPVEPYLTRLVRRNELDEEELVHALSQFLFAGVDTTANVLMLLLVDLAENPEQQDKLLEEIKRELGDGPLTPENVRSLKFLNYAMRESHRMRPFGKLSVMRRLYKDIELAGYTIPQDTRIFLCHYPIQNDPAIVDDPDKFLPERWAPEEVAKRAGTPKEVLDHRLLQDPFGFGPRMCLGARVAKSEIKALVTQLVRDWRFTIAPEQTYKMTGFPSFAKVTPYPKFTWEARK